MRGASGVAALLCAGTELGLVATDEQITEIYSLAREAFFHQIEFWGMAPSFAFVAVGQRSLHLRHSLSLRTTRTFAAAARRIRAAGLDGCGSHIRQSHRT